MDITTRLHEIVVKCPRKQLEVLLYAPEHLGSHLQPISDIELIRLWVDPKSPRSQRFSWQAGGTVFGCL